MPRGRHAQLEDPFVVPRRSQFEAQGQGLEKSTMGPSYGRGGPSEGHFPASWSHGCSSSRRPCGPTLHAEPQKATHGKKAEDCTGDDETAPSMEDVHRKEAQNIVHEHDINTCPEHAHWYVLELERNGIREVFDFPLERSLYLDKKMGRRCQRQLLHIDDGDL